MHEGIDRELKYLDPYFLNLRQHLIERISGSSAPLILGLND